MTELPLVTQSKSPSNSTTSSLSFSISSPSATPSIPSSINSSTILANIDQEIAFFQNALSFRPVGPNKHFQMAVLLDRLQSFGFPNLSSERLWNYVESLYDLVALEKLYILQQEDDKIQDLWSPTLGTTRKKGSTVTSSTQSPGVGAVPHMSPTVTHGLLYQEDKINPISSRSTTANENYPPVEYNLKNTDVESYFLTRSDNVIKEKDSKRSPLNTPSMLNEDLSKINKSSASSRSSSPLLSSPPPLSSSNGNNSDQKQGKKEKPVRRRAGTSSLKSSPQISVTPLSSALPSDNGHKVVVTKTASVSKRKRTATMEEPSPSPPPPPDTEKIRKSRKPKPSTSVATTTKTKKTKEKAKGADLKKAETSGAASTRSSQKGGQEAPAKKRMKKSEATNGLSTTNSSSTTKKPRGRKTK